jgi:hypothetical protein
MSHRSRISSLGRITLAYLLALQALLGAFAGPAAAATPNGFDPSLVLCRTATGEPQNQGSDRDGAAPPHCVVMCLSGACAAGDPPAAITAEVEFQAPRVRAAALPALADAAVGALLPPAVNARGPPSIV